MNLEKRVRNLENLVIGLIKKVDRNEYYTESEIYASNLRLQREEALEQENSEAVLEIADLASENSEAVLEIADLASENSEAVIELGALENENSEALLEIADLLDGLLQNA